MQFKPAPSVTKSSETKIAIQHTLPQELGEQKLHVTLKDGDGKRIDRKVVTISGKGLAEIEFDVPKIDRVRFSAFVGEDYTSNLQHITSDPVTTK